MDSILALIPQRPPMVMVDTFLGMEGAVSRTRFTVRADNIFVNDGYFSECGIIEHIAQSAAARVGFICVQKNMPISIGYIGAVNDFKALAPVVIGDTLETVVEVIQEVLGITLIQADCKVGGHKVAMCKMKIFVEKSID